MNITLRDTDKGRLTDHHFISAEHAKDFLKADNGNNERFTVCFFEEAVVMGGALMPNMKIVHREITCDQFIDEVMNGEHI